MKAYIFISAHRDFGRSPSLVLIGVKCKFSHTWAGRLLPEYVVSKPQCGRFRYEKPTYFSGHSGSKGNEWGSDLAMYILENQHLGKTLSNHMAHLWIQTLIISNVKGKVLISPKGLCTCEHHGTCRIFWMINSQKIIALKKVIPMMPCYRRGVISKMV